MTQYAEIYAIKGKVEVVKWFGGTDWINSKKYGKLE